MYSPADSMPSCFARKVTKRLPVGESLTVISSISFSPATAHLAEKARRIPEGRAGAKYGGRNTGKHLGGLPSVSSTRGAKLPACRQFGLILTAHRNLAVFKPFSNRRLSAAERFGDLGLRFEVFKEVLWCHVSDYRSSDSESQTRK